MVWLCFALTLVFTAAIAFVVRVLGRELADSRELLRQSINLIAAKSATDAAEAEAIKNKATLELEMMRDALRVQHEASKASASILSEEPIHTDERIITSDGRVLHELSLDDF